jgi:hypothetical protein
VLLKRTHLLHACLVDLCHQLLKVAVNALLQPARQAATRQTGRHAFFLYMRLAGRLAGNKSLQHTTSSSSFTTVDT